MDAIDVVMLTKNSEHLLNKSIKSIYDNVPVNRLIIIDGSSVDNTLSILHKINKKHGNIRVIIEKSSRAKARERGIKEVETEWFMFVDSDVILCKDWYKKIQKYLKDDVGAIWGLNIDVIPNVKNKFFLKSLMLVARECFKLRGGMHDTLIRRKLVEDIKIPEELHAYEDLYIVNWIKKKGYKVLVGNQIFCLHYRPFTDWNIKESVSLASLEIKCGLYHSHVFQYAFYYPFFVFYWFLQVFNTFFPHRKANQR